MSQKINKIIVIGVFFAVHGFAAEYPLVIDGKSDSVIQMNPRPSAQEYRAAVELQNYVKQVSGAVIKRSTYPAVHYRTKDKADFIEILPASLEYAKLLMPEAMYEKLSKAKSADSFYIKTEGKRILIIGKTPSGVLYGTYAFIEKHLGVRWLHPGADGEYCPSSKNILLDEIDDFQEPTVRGRYLNCYAKSVEPWTIEEVRIWQMRNKMNFDSPYHYPNRSREELDFYACGNHSVFGGGHETFEAAIPKKLFQEHPEYFPWKEGQRVCEARSQRCLANTAVQQRVIAYYLEMAAYGAQCSISFHDSSFDFWCQCPDCIEMGTYKGLFTVSNLAHKFTSLVANKILEHNPEASVGIDMYNVFRDPPRDTGIRYDSRIKGMYCPHQRCYIHRLDDPKSECNAKFFEQINAWKKLLPLIGIYDYYSVAHSPYAPMEYILADDMKYYQRIGLDYWTEDACNASPMMASNWQLYYVAAKMLWDASLDMEKLMTDAYEKYYGVAAVPMKNYHAYRRALWEGAPGHVGYGGPDRINHCLTVPGAEKRLFGWLNEAEKLAGGDATLQRRLATDRQYLAQFWVTGAEKLKKVMSAQNDVPVNELEGKVIIDGILDEDGWRSARPVTGFMTADGSAPIEETRVKVLYDHDNWYIGIEAMTEHAWSVLKSKAQKHDDGEVCHDDSMEILLMPPEAEYFHWIINSAGTFYDAKRRDIAFDSKAEIRTRVLKDRYVIEARIPVSPMGTKLAEGQVWKIHFWRNCNNLQPPGTAQGSSLDGTGPHNSMLFRRAIIGKNIFPNGHFAELIDTPQADRDKGAIPSEKFPKHWGGSKVSLIVGSNNKNRVEMKDGVMYGYLQVPLTEHGNLITGTVFASGNGLLKAWVSSCVRKPGDRTRGFGHEIRHEAGSWKLKDLTEPHPFKFELSPYETGFFYLSVSGTALIECVSAVNVPLSKPEVP